MKESVSSSSKANGRCSLVAESLLLGRNKLKSLTVLSDKERWVFEWRAGKRMQRASNRPLEVDQEKKTGKLLQDPCPIVDRKGSQESCPKPEGMTRVAGKCWGCQAPTKREGHSRVLILVRFTGLGLWNKKLLAFLFRDFFIPYVLCLGKGRITQKFLSMGGMHSDPYYLPWPVCWNPKILIKIIFLTRVHEIHPLN